MKTFYALVLVVFLASCGENNIVTTSQTNPIAQTSVEQTGQDISSALSELPDDLAEEELEEIFEEAQKPEPEVINIEAEIVEVSEPEVEVSEVSEPEATIVAANTKVVEIATTYISPKHEVIMDINYNLDDDNTITEISVTSPNYRQMSKFNNGIQNVIGSTVEEAAKYNVSGSSLTTVAFQEALKNM